ncbi:hypothetical protein ONZ43_g4838 [Nemania bipapillata]|uniref:Uncharacterized protein n=1 Tax=Nemania bipapillata TaxID=110536 RepID=A0ACC2IHP5_9PEZI|nr:hypothetical protein ONZ43_g4838 [Nemania bipapillata]
MRLHDQPSLDLLTTQPACSTAYLKAASLVSRRWRSLVLPCLFRHVVWKPNVYSLSAFALNPIPLLRYLIENHLARNVMTFTMIIDFHDPVTAEYLKVPQIRAADLEWLWDQLFSIVDPLRFTILARPTTLAALLSRMLYLDDAWIDRLFVQLIPKSGSGILEDTDEMRYIDPGDLWMERNTSYSFLMRELTVAANPQVNWGLLRVFESGDAAADREAWQLAVHFLENSGMQDWRAEREGVFVRHADNGQPSEWSDEVNGHVGGFANVSNSNLLLVPPLH